MRRPYPRLAAACALAVATAALGTGSAFAGGNPNAPGQQKKDAAAQQSQTQTQAQTTQAPAQQPAPAQQQTTQQQTTTTTAEQHGNSAQAHGHASGGGGSSTQAGVKPSSTTTHWTHCTTGTSSSGATCTSSDNGHTPQTGSDVSKRYGNGKTAAQIAVSRGGTNVQLTGPGNSQPHKVSVCGKPSNKSGGVDVHAVKSYSNASCAPTQETTQPPTAPCGYVVVAITDDATVHGNGKGIVHSKHVTSSTHYVLRRDESQLCGTTTTVTLPGTTTTLPGATTTLPGTTTTVPGTTTTVPGTTTTVPGSTTTVGTTTTRQQGVTTGTTTTTATGGTRGAGGVSGTSTHSSTGGVLGASTTLKPQRAPVSHGVLGTVTHVASGTLPFTGFPIWAAVLIALALIGVGVALRRRGATSP